VTTSAGTTSLSYDYEDGITGITYPSSATNSFAYNCLDTRVGKTDSSGTATYQRDGVGVTAPLLTDGSSTFTPGVSQNNGSTSTFDCADRLGTYSVETNSSQSTTATRQFDAFGNPTSTTGSPAGPFGFAGGWGYQQDGDSSLKLLGHRYYDSSTGRFLTRDTAMYGRNWYAYCANSPLRHVDPTGQFALPPSLLRIVFTILAWIGGIGQSGGDVTTTPPGSKNPPYSAKSLKGTKKGNTEGDGGDGGDDDPPPGGGSGVIIKSNGMTITTDAISDDGQKSNGGTSVNSGGGFDWGSLGEAVGVATIAAVPIVIIIVVSGGTAAAPATAFVVEEGGATAAGGAATTEATGVASLADAA